MTTHEQKNSNVLFLRTLRAVRVGERPDRRRFSVDNYFSERVKFFYRLDAESLSPAMRIIDSQKDSERFVEKYKRAH